MTDDIDNDGTTLHESGGVGLPAYNPWRESLENCITGDNYLRSTEWRQLIEELDRLYAIEALAVPQAPLQAEPVPVVASNWHPHHVAVEKATLQMIRNALRTDAEAGRSVRAEMLEMLDAATHAIVIATPQAEPAVAEQAQEPKLQRAAWDYAWVNSREDFDRVRVAFLAGAALASQSTPPPESAAGTIKYCCYAAYCEAGHSPDCAILAANPTAQPDGGSKA